MNEVLFNRPVSIDEVKQLLNFGAQNNDLVRNMAEVQAQGTAALYNILCGGSRSYAYLADEVGMGKTFQALGVACLVWRLKPEARILIIAPRQNVQEKWKREYEMFVRTNYRLRDNRVADSIFKNPVHKPLFCNNLQEFINGAISTNNGLLITRLPMFSYLDTQLGLKDANKRGGYSDTVRLLKGWGIKAGFRVGGKMLDPDNAGKYAAMLVNTRLPSFDLVIIDEAQNIRYHDNNRSTALTLLLGLNRTPSLEEEIERFIPDIPCYGPRCSRVLLMSATPAHSSIYDIRSQLSYFENDKAVLDPPPDKTMPYYMIRRYRRLCNLTKYQYRMEQPVQTELTDIKDILFLALVQKRLAETLTKNNNLYKIGFLEAFESYSAGTDTLVSPETEEEGQMQEFTDTSGDDKEAPDKQAIIKITRAFAEYMKGTDTHHPPHPKHGLVSEEARKVFRSPDLKKLLIFVRRIASVEELRNRIAEVFDQVCAEKVLTLLKETSKEGVGNALRLLEQGLQGESIGYDEEHESELEEEDNVEDLAGYKSRFMDLFAVKKGTANTAGGKFRQRFNDNRPLSGFFEENYVLTWYQQGRDRSVTCDSLEYREFVDQLVDEGFVRQLNHYIMNKENDYFTVKKNRKATAIYRLVTQLALSRLAARESPSMNLAQQWCSMFALQDGGVESNPQIPATAAIRIDEKEIIEILTRNSFWNELVARGRSLEYSAFLLADLKDQLIRREYLKAWISKNLRMSDAVIDLAVIYIQANMDEKRFIQYFVAYLIDEPTPNDDTYWFTKKLNNRLNELVRNYDLILRQIGTGSDSQWDRWSVFNGQQPVRGISGGSQGRDTAVRQFNTPFFPDIIVCTDVLKEGVDMHLFCDEVWHYGVAWTPGDLEQRTGRIDRYFSLVHRRLQHEDSAGLEPETRLNIAYPYVPNTIDEHQLFRVISNKALIQEMTDKGLTAEFSRELSVGTIEEIDLNGAFKLAAAPLNIDPLPGKAYLQEKTTGISRIEIYEKLGDSSRIIQLVGCWLKRMHVDKWIKDGESTIAEPAKLEQCLSTAVASFILGTDKHRDYQVAPIDQKPDRRQGVFVKAEFDAEEQRHYLGLYSPIGVVERGQFDVEFEKYRRKYGNGYLARSFDSNASSAKVNIKVRLPLDLTREKGDPQLYEEFRQAAFSSAMIADKIEDTLLKQDQEVKLDIEEN